MINLHLGKLSSAIQYFSRVLDLESDHPDALLGCAVAMDDHGYCVAVHGSMLQCIVARCTCTCTYSSRCTAWLCCGNGWSWVLWCSALQCVASVAVHCTVLQCGAVRRSVLWSVAECYRVLQSVAVCCTVAMDAHGYCHIMWCSALQFVVVCCSVL